MSNTTRRGFFGTIAAAVAALVASRAVSALPTSANTLPRGARTHAALREMLGEDQYLSWFFAMRIGDCDGRVLHASVPVNFFKGWIEDHYTNDLLAAARTEFPGIERVELKLARDRAVA